MASPVPGLPTGLSVGTYDSYTGAWLGLFVGLLLGLFTDEGWSQIILFSVLWGALFMLIFGLVGYAATGGRRDFTSQNVTIAGKYEIFCQHQHAEQAREVLAKLALRNP